MKVDLRECKKGDILVSKHGEMLRYDSFHSERFYPHIVTYPCGSKGSRIDSGHVFEKKRLFEDHDIVQVIPLSILGKEG